jgi:hypothetical protein
MPNGDTDSTLTDRPRVVIGSEVRSRASPAIVRATSREEQACHTVGRISFRDLIRKMGSIK